MPKVLLLRFSSIGDIVLTSPIIRCLKAQVNDIEIHFLTKQSFASILTTNPDVTKVFTIQKKVCKNSSPAQIYEGRKFEKCVKNAQK